jgi:hypothetical protein
MKRCEFETEVLIAGRLQRRRVIADDETLVTRRALLKGSQQRVNVGREDFLAFKRWHKSAALECYDKRPNGFSRRDNAKSIRAVSGGLPTLGKKR